MWINLQVDWELSRWLRRIIRSLSLKVIHWLWNAPIHFLGALIFFGMSNIPTEVSNSFWNTWRRRAWWKAALVLRLNLIRAKALSTSRNDLLLGVMLLCTSVLGESQCWGLQGQLHSNLSTVNTIFLQPLFPAQEGGVVPGYATHCHWITI